jgi:hypothetical protein
MCCQGSFMGKGKDCGRHDGRVMLYKDGGGVGGLGCTYSTGLQKASGGIS